MTLRIRDFVFENDRPAADLDPDGDFDGISGQYARHWVRDGEHVFARDALGVNKLFFAIDADGNVDVASFWIDLVRKGHPAATVWSVPSGHRMRIAQETRGFDLTRVQGLVFAEEEGGVSKPALAGKIRARLDAHFRGLAEALDGRSVYVTLSGGLDSSSIAALARQHLGRFTAVTFARAEEAETPGSDLDAARRVADSLDVDFEVVRPTGEEVVAQLDDVLVHGQDWREFNVHCALVNACVADGIAAHHARSGAVGGVGGAGAPVVLTGDGMNELMADYTAVSYEGRDYYRLPRMTPGRLRRFLVSGLDSGDREIGVFASRGIDALQPYAICADAYSAVPDAWLEQDDAKQALAREVIGDVLPEFVFMRPKVRAQVGSSAEVGGTLGLLADRGLDQEALAARFATLFGMGEGELRGMIRAGFYRFPTSYPGTE